MKRFFSTLFCMTLVLFSSVVLACAAETTVPEKQGDFYVLVNGQYVTFTDAVPKIKNDRSCLPFVAVFEQLGFAEKDMTWNGQTSTVTATKGNLTISLTIGQNQITLIENGDPTVIETDVAPYIEPALSRTYVPFGLVADALGYNVGWDANSGTVIIDDVDAILAANTATYSISNQMLTLPSMPPQESYLAEGTFSLRYEENGEGRSFFAPFTLLADGQKYEYHLDVASRSGAYIYPVFGNTELLMWFYLLDGADELDIRGDTETGTHYFHWDWEGTEEEIPWRPITENYSYLLECIPLTVDTSLWSEIRPYGSVESYLSAVLKAYPLTDDSQTCTQLLETLNFLLADSAYTKQGRTYTLDWAQQLGIDMSFTLKTSGGKVVSYESVTRSGSLLPENITIRTKYEDGLCSSSLLMEEDYTLTTRDENGNSVTSTVHEETEVAYTLRYKDTDRVPEIVPPKNALYSEE